MKRIIFDYNKLKGRIKEKCGTQTALAENISINLATLSNKLNNNVYFDNGEVIDICEKLNIPLNKIPEYFFNFKVREDEQK